MSLHKGVLANVFLALLLPNAIFAQKLCVGVGGGIGRIMSPDSYTRVTHNIVGEMVDPDHAFEIIGKIKVQTSKFPLRFVGQISFLSITDQGNYLGILDPPDSYFSDIHLEASSQILSMGIGAEYKLLPTAFSPFVSIDLLINSFGDTKLYTDPSSQDKEWNEITHITSIPKGIRLGMGLGIGVQYPLSQKLNLTIDANYAIMNMAGRKRYESFGEIGREKLFERGSLKSSILFQI